MVDVTIRMYADRKCINTFDNLWFPTMAIAEDFIDDFFESYHGSCWLKAEIVKTKEAPDEIDFDALEELVSDDDAFVDELELEDIEEAVAEEVAREVENNG